MYQLIVVYIASNGRVNMTE